MPQHNNQVTVLHSTLKWPEGAQDICAVCGQALRIGMRVAVVDVAFHRESPDDGLYAHALCVQEVCVKKGSHCPVRNYGKGD